MNTPVSFDLAKLLKEKGYYKPLEDIFYSVYDIEDKTLMKNVHQSTLIKGKGLFYHAPTITDVVMWLYEKHGIWIQTLPYDTITAAKEWTATILSLNWGEDKEIHYEYKLGGLNSPTYAYEAAIEYTLKFLIK